MLFADAEKKVLPPNIQLYIARGIEPCNSTASGEARAVSLNFNKTRKNYGISWYGGAVEGHSYWKREARKQDNFSRVPNQCSGSGTIGTCVGSRRDAEHLGSAGQWARTIRLFLFLTALG